MKLERSLYIKMPNNIHNNFGIEFICEDANEGRSFQNWMMINVFGNQMIKDKLHPFFQGGYNLPYGDIESFENWKYVEFWCDKNSAENHELILKIMDQISKEFNIDYDIK